ncbi:MAG TPA: hypothetical protein VKG25_27225 [Bryobacteraceae bacterium]|nr:hypothetical protein [Bryobacteraceae bacterium]
MFCSAVRTCVTPLILGALLIAGCGSGSMQTIAPAQAPQIITQPANQSVPLGQTGAFTVVASGTAPLTYQWSENGAALANSNSPTYTTAIVGPVDSGAKFSVAVTNSAGSINSSDAVLTVGPRSPKAADLRFQQVSAASTLTPPTGSGLHSDVNAGIDQGFQDSIGSPITIGGNCVTPPTGNPYTCDWFFSSFPLPTGLSGLSINYQSTNNYANLNSDLQALALPNTVITSLDLQPASGTYALSSIQTAQTTGFDQSAQTVLPAQFPIAAAQAGAQSRVITAVSFDATGQVFFLSYGWQADTTTVYDVSVVSTTFDNIAASATNLAAEGYIITAIGGNFTDGFLLVGTRVKGDSLARPLIIISLQGPGSILWQSLQQGYSIIGYLVSADGTNAFMIGEK